MQVCQAVGCNFRLHHRLGEEQFHFNDNMAVFKSKSAISSMKESVVKCTWIASTNILGIAKEDRSHGEKPRLPDQENEWSVCRGELSYVRGRLDQERLDMRIELSSDAFLSNGQSLKKICWIATCSAA